MSVIIFTQITIHSKDENNIYTFQSFDGSVSLFCVQIIVKLASIIKNLIFHWSNFLRIMLEFEIILINFSDLFLQNNHIKKIHPGAFEHSEIFILNIKNNELDELLEGTFANMNVWRFLDISNNTIASLESDVFKNSTFTHVILNDNKLSTIKNGVFNGTKMHVLDIKNNEITALEDQCFHNLPYTYHIDLRDNKLQDVYKKSFKDVRNLHFIYLEGNPAMNTTDFQDFKTVVPYLISFKHLSPKY